MLHQSPSMLIFSLVLVSLMAFIGIMSTSFVKLSVVFSILRNALGVQQIPPNMAIYGLCIILTAYIMSPVGHEAYRITQEKKVDWNNIEEVIDVGSRALEPLREFLIKHSSKVERQFFVSSAKKIWPKEQADQIDANSFLIVIPAFTVSELTSAFQIGFLIYLPFLVIDIVVSNILLALGMMMVSPMTISLPFKLLLFVVIDGWARLIHGLVLSYQ